jgi:hypothetical protein
VAAKKQIVRIGCGAGFWGDSPEGPRQLVESGQIDYLMLDYLAEITMSLLAKSRVKDPNLGYATDFPDVLVRLAPEIKKRGIRVVTNAGGVNPGACQAAIEAKLKTAGIELKIGIVLGDDLLPRADELRTQGIREMFDGSGFPAAPWSINAYLGAFPIATALNAGADIVLTGRCVDSALALAPLIHEFGWTPTDYDKLSAGSLAGHIIECGAQATGGIITDWEETVDDWDCMGFPIAECREDGTFTITKPSGTGGRITPETVAEQIVYEIGDPAAYLLPDVSCDFRSVELKQAGSDCVEVRGAAGRAPTDSYKVSLTYQDGFRAGTTMMLGGFDAARKAQRVAEAILKRTRRLFEERKLGDYTRTDIEILGADANYGVDPQESNAREVILKLAVQHANKAALELFSREVIPSATAMAQGITGFAGGRPTPAPLVRLFSFLVEKSAISIDVEVDGRKIPFTETLPVPAAATAARPAPTVKTATLPSGATVQLPLLAIAYGRSGDKGDTANIGVLARRAEFVPLLRTQLTADAVKKYFAHFTKGEVERFEIPGLKGFNFVMHNALGGGGMASLRYDPQGKMLAQLLMSFPVQVPKEWADKGLAKSPTSAKARA